MKQLLTIHYQLYKGLYGEPPDHNDWWVTTDEEDPDTREEIDNEIQELVKWWG